VKAAGFRYSSIGRSVADGRPEAVRTQQ